MNMKERRKVKKMVWKDLRRVCICGKHFKKFQPFCECGRRVRVTYN